MMKRSVNPARLAQGVTALVMALALFWLAASRSYQQYVTPRTQPYLYFASAMLLLMAAQSFRTLFEATHVRHYTHLLALLIPFVLLVASVSEKGLWSAPLFAAGSDAQETVTLREETYAMKADGYAGRVLHGYNAADQTLTVPDSELYFWLTEIYTDPTPFLGFTMTVEGQVMKDAKHFPEGNCFSPVRKLMTCCVADLYSVGFKCQFDQTQALAADAWVKVTGKLTLVDMGGGMQDLRIIADSVTACNPADEPYVYAY